MTILFSRTSRAISSRMSPGTSAIGPLLRHRRAERQCVNARHDAPQGAVYELMLLDERLPREGGRAHLDVEVVAGAGRVRDPDPRTRQRLLDQPADVCG